MGYVHHKHMYNNQIKGTSIKPDLFYFLYQNSISATHKEVVITLNHTSKKKKTSSQKFILKSNKLKAIKQIISFYYNKDSFFYIRYFKLKIFFYPFFTIKSTLESLKA